MTSEWQPCQGQTKRAPIPGTVVEGVGPEIKTAATFFAISSLGVLDDRASGIMGACQVGVPGAGYAAP